MVGLISEIREIVGDTGLLVGDEVTGRAENWMGLGSISAQAIIRPASTEELSQVMAACYRADQPVVPMGGLTGLVLGTQTTGSEVVISLERMREIETLDETGATMIVQAGVALQSVQERAEQAGLCFPLDLGARGSANIGGLISTNAGGNQVIRYGMMREQVLGLEAVLADGTIISSMNRMLKNNAGYDLKQLFIGSEGTLGIVTRAVLRLRPALSSDNTVLVALNNFENIPKLLRLFGSALGGTLNAFEVMWQNYYQLILNGNPAHKAPMPDHFAYYILIEAAGGDQEADLGRFMQTLETALEQELIEDAVLANSGEQRDALWAIRDDIMTLVVTMLPIAAFDVSLPIADMESYIEQVEQKMHEKWGDRAKLAVFGHLGDSNIHLAIGTGVENELDHGDAEHVVYDPLVPFGGSVSAEHGIGLEKKAWLSSSRSPAEVNLMKTLKQALDPKNILNPGKVLD
ncbi:MAG: FAD-binding oxidoreductase [Robiginitomaculum sp.]|nr:MAG: FAD-binding oxidoreductase [Robiginitomaculum sp.]